MTVDDLTFDDRGLIPAVVQQYDTGEVLMVAWMNAESLRLTQETGTRGSGVAAARSSGTRAPRAVTCSRSRIFSRTATRIPSSSRSTRPVPPVTPATAPVFSSISVAQNSVFNFWALYWGRCE